MPGALFLLLAFLPSIAGARIMINEIFYHAPNDIEDLEYIELHNSGDQAVDLGGWTLSKGIQFEFAAGTRIEAHGFLVLCRNADRFKEYYDAPIAGVFNQPLSHKGARIRLSDASGRVVDSVKYQDSPPWPAGPDGWSGSLERISPDAGGEEASNWVSSPLSEDRDKPAGTPGRANAGFSAHLPPVISKVKSTPESPSPGQPLAVEADLRDGSGVSAVNLLYRVAGPGFEGPETTLAMNTIPAGRYSAVIPGQGADQLIRFRVQAIGVDGAQRFFPAENEPRPALSSYVHGPIEPADIPFGWIINTTKSDAEAARLSSGPVVSAGGASPSGPAPKVPVSNRSAFVFFDPATREVALFDFVRVAPRQEGVKVHFQKDRPLHKMTTINLIFKGEAPMLVEPLAYELYRRAGLPAEQSYHVRLWLNGRPLGYHLLVEQPNRAFLRRNHIQDDGNLYKKLWREPGIVARHKKKTHVHEGHDDIIGLIVALQKTAGDEQWELIRKNFDVEEVAGYFAVNTVLSDWDGFFNNYVTYHDINGTGKWTMYPWDQDETWGAVGRREWGQVFYTMPITFGMKGDVPPEQKPGAGQERGAGFGHSAEWWREPGYFSGPLLANQRFRARFLARTKKILETIYTEKVFFPVIAAMGERLKPEAKLRAELSQSDPDRAAADLEENLQSLREHLTKRREFLLAEDEIKNVGRSSRTPPE